MHTIPISSGDYQMVKDGTPFQFRNTATNDILVPNRLAAPQPERRWIPFTERKPHVRDDYPIRVCTAGDRGYAHFATEVVSTDFTHWMHDDTPPIPPKEKTQADIDKEACDQFIRERVEADRRGDWRQSDVRDAFNAALRYARSLQGKD